MKRLTLGISAAVLVVAGTAFGTAGAQEQHEAGQNLTRAEAQARAEHLFDKLDVNHDGKLDEADRAARDSQRINEIFDRLDTNHDGKISREEFAAAHEHMRGHDHGAEHPGPDHPAGPDHPGISGDHPGGHMGHWGEGHHEMHGLVMLILHRADPNHAGFVTRDAFVRAALSLFDEADTNHDGIETPEEHRAAMQALHEKMRARWQEHHGQDEGGPGQQPPAPPAH